MFRSTLEKISEDIGSRDLRRTGPDSKEIVEHLHSRGNDRFGSREDCLFWEWRPKRDELRELQRKLLPEGSDFRVPPSESRSESVVVD